MLLELDADQRLWQQTVRDAVSKQCPVTLIRSIAESGGDAGPLWKLYVEQGWTFWGPADDVMVPGTIHAFRWDPKRKIYRILPTGGGFSKGIGHLLHSLEETEIDTSAFE